MNIYLINEDGEQFCIRAKTMFDAVEVCLKSYLEDRKEETRCSVGKYHGDEGETKYYHSEVLQSCSLIGKLKN